LFKDRDIKKERIIKTNQNKYRVINPFNADNVSTTGSRKISSTKQANIKIKIRKVDLRNSLYIGSPYHVLNYNDISKYYY